MTLRYPFPRSNPLSVPGEFAMLRESRPLALVEMPSGDPAWVATTYHDISTIMADHHTFSRQLTTADGAPRYTGACPQLDTLATLDPPAHKRLRKVLAHAFSAESVRAREPFMRALARELLHRIVLSGPPADLVRDYAEPFSTAVMCSFLGIPTADSAIFRPWSDAALTNSAGDQADREPIGWERLRQYVHPFLYGTAARPDDSVLATIARATASGHITRDEGRQLAVTVLITGHETTISRVAAALLFLLENPAIAHLLDDPGLPGRATDELLRLIPAGDGSFMSIARTDVVLSGQTVAAGAAVLTPVTAANHDPAIFPAPAEFRLRGRPRNASFGFGVHRCLGAALAATELRIAIETTHQMLPTAFASAPSGAVTTNQDVSVHPVDELIVSW